jgi:alkylhydroperoxidase family enzyme
VEGVYHSASDHRQRWRSIDVHGPAALQADGVLAASMLSQQHQETVKLLISEVAGCDYGVAAHSLLNKMTGLALEVLKQIRAVQPTGDAKRNTLVRCVKNLAEISGTISDEEVSAIKAAGDTDQPLVEISLASAGTVFTNVCNRSNDNAIALPAVA